MTAEMSRNATRVRVRVVMLPDTCPACSRTGALARAGLPRAASTVRALAFLQERFNNTRSGRA